MTIIPKKRPQTTDHRPMVTVFDHYQVWRELYVAYTSLKKGQKTNINKDRLRVLRKQIIRQYFKNFFLFPIWFFRFFKPSYMKGPVTAWDNLKTWFKALFQLLFILPLSKEFRPLRLAVLSQLCFVLVFIQLGVFIVRYSSFQTEAASYGWIQTDWSGSASTTAYGLHTSNRTGWTKFSSTSSVAIDTSVTGEVSLSPPVTTHTETSDADFNTWTKSSSVYIPTGGNKITLLKPNGATCTIASECSGGGV